MWSVALTDFFQMIIIMVGMLLVGFFFADKAGGATHVITEAIQAGKFSLFGADGVTFATIIALLSAVLTM
jgi:Na+/proline symporter